MKTLIIYYSFQMEYSTHGIGDFRESCLQVRDSKGHTDCKLQYISHEIFKIRITKKLNILGWQGFLDRTMGVINTYSY